LLELLSAFSSWPLATSRSYGRVAEVVAPCPHPNLRRQQPLEMWLLVRRSGFAVVVAPGPHPNFRRQQPLEMWLLVRRSGFAVRAVCAGTLGTRGPILVELTELAWIATARTAAVSANATRAAASLERLRALVC
jgi:hypothetical protein